MRGTVKAAAAVAAVGALVGCTTPRPPDLECRGLTPGLVAASPLRGGADDNVGAIATAVTRFVQAPGARRQGRVQLDYLVMSTGGQWGAFGSGFLAGWSSNRSDPRPGFEIVTGASAGGVISPAALAGPAFDDRLTLFAGVGIDDVARRRGLLELFASSSVFDVAPFEARLRAAVDPPLVEALAGAHRAGRSVFVGAVNMDTTQFEALDIGRFAAETGANAEACIEEALLATSAIPGLFPPRHINGSLYGDAGLRDHVFFSGVRRAVGQARAAGIAVDLNAYVVINGDLRVPGDPVEHNLKDLALRSFAIAGDQGLRSSVLEVIRLGRETDWTIRAVTARDVDLSACAQPGGPPPNETLFDACVTQTLFDAGRALASAPRIDWLSAAKLRMLAEGD